MQHDKLDDCWVIIGLPGHEKVYDLTTFLKDHPGGSSIILLYSGKKNATDEFIRVGHNMKARNTLETFCVGKLANS